MRRIGCGLGATLGRYGMLMVAVFVVTLACSLRLQ